MVMPALARDWTVEMVRALPDDNMRHEVVDGELFVTPAPAWSHGEVIAELHLLFAEYLRANRAAHVKFAPADIVYDNRTMVEPDLFVVPLVDGRKPFRWEDVRKLLLAVEVLSPSTARLDRQVKRRLYQREGVPEYWIVDADARLIERWRPSDERPEIIHDTLVWHPEGAATPLTIDVPALFERALGG